MLDEAEQFAGGFVTFYILKVGIERQVCRS
jgi:hypothetical protein